MNQMPYIPYQQNIPQPYPNPSILQPNTIEQKVDRLERYVKRVDYKVKQLEIQLEKSTNNIDYYNDDIYMM